MILNTMFNEVLLKFIDWLLQNLEAEKEANEHVITALNKEKPVVKTTIWKKDVLK